MDNLLATTVKFFLIPEAALSAVFLLIFVALFGLGIYWERQCRAELNEFAATGEEKFETLRRKMSPDLFIKKNLRKISASEGKIEELPNVFVSVGIVATFLGLGVAIQGAAELLQTDKLELAKLTAVLGVIAFKFQTSVWGICCSLIFRRFVVERYFEFRQEIVDELYDRLYSLERDSIRTLLEQQNDFIAAHLAWQKDFEAQKISQQSAQHEALLAENHKILGALEYLVVNFERFVDIAANFEKNTTTFIAAVNEFSARVENFKAELTEFLSAEFADLKAINENYSRRQTESIEKIHAEHESNIFYVTQKLDELHQKFYLDANRFVRETQQVLDQILKETISSVHDEYSHEAQEIRKTIAELNSTLSFMQNSLNNLTQEFAEEQKQFVAAWKNNFDRISETMLDVSKTAADSTENLENTQEILLAIAEDIKKTVDKFTNEATSARAEDIRNLEETQRNFLAAVSEIKNLMAESHAQELANIEQTQKIFITTVAEMKHSADTNRAEINNFLADTSRQISQATDNLAGKISDGNAKNISTLNISTVLQKKILETLNKILEKSAITSTPVPPPQPKKIDTTKPTSVFDSAVRGFFSRKGTDEK